MRTVHVAAMLMALMAAIRAHAQTSVTNTPEGFQSQFHAQKFGINYMLDAPGHGARLTAWIESFIYIDGAFRFFGQGSKPFWAPAKSEIHPSVSSNDAESRLAPGTGDLTVTFPA